MRWAKTGHRVYCVDVSHRAIELTQRMVGESTTVSFHVCDGFEFVSKFDEPIDLLYVDGPNPSEFGQLFAESLVQNAPMRNESVILIDDCDFADNGKGKLAIPAAIAMGFELVELGRQALLVRNF
jgi:hypothetical protein